MVRPRTFIRFVNSAVSRGSHDRRIVLVKQNMTPSSGHNFGLAATTHCRNKDEIRIPKGLPRTRQDAQRLARTEQGENIKRNLGLRRIPTEREVIRHELWHIVKPSASESTIQRVDSNKLPRRLPERRTRRFDKTR